jgi:predicted CoA-substrate-specific enzyme activase
VIDIGGQDSKIIRLDERGGVRDFVMNDKCAAGTGRFLEMMAQSLGLSIEEMGIRGLSSRESITISSMCSVFAQSEVVSLIASGKRVEDIVRGLNRSVAAKVTALAGRRGMEREWMMTGGVAKNPGVVAAIEERLGGNVLIPEEPELCGALGAALIAREEAGS